MDLIIERKIGEIFEYNGEWYQCVGGTCRNCSFYYDTVCKNITTIGSTNFGNCHCSLRTDHKSVIFKKLEKDGFAIKIKQNKEDMEEKKIQHYDCFFDREPSKSNLKPFDLEAAKSGKPVCTRDGRKARIICFDAKGDPCPIIALVEENGIESAYHYDKNGQNAYNKSKLDLMMLLEKKSGWVNIFVNGEYTVSNIYTTEQSAKVNAIIGKAVDTIQIE